MAIRKILLLPLVCLSSVFYCYAGTGSFAFGADAGPGFSALYGSAAYLNGENFRKIEPSVSVGINFRYNFPKIISIGAGVYYCQLSYNRYRSDSLSFPEPYSRGTWNVINIPLLARLSFGKKVIFFIEAGPFLSIVLTSPVLLAGWDVMPPNPSIPAWKSTNPINVGITAGVGVEVPLPHHFALSFKAQGNVGLTNVSFDIKTYTCTLLCGFNYTFP